MPIDPSYYVYASSTDHIDAVPNPNFNPTFQTPFPTELTQSQVFMLKSSRPQPEPDGHRFSPVPALPKPKPNSNSNLRPVVKRVYTGTTARRIRNSTSSRNLKENSGKYERSGYGVLSRKSSVSSPRSRLNLDLDLDLDSSRTAVKTLGATTDDGSRTRRTSSDNIDTTTRKESLFAIQATGILASRSRNSRGGMVRSTEDLSSAKPNKSKGKGKNKPLKILLQQHKSLASPFTSRPSSPSVSPPGSGSRSSSAQSESDTIFNPKRTLAETYYNNYNANNALELPARKRHNNTESSVRRNAWNGQMQSKSTHTSPVGVLFGPSRVSSSVLGGGGGNLEPALHRRPSYPTIASSSQGLKFADFNDHGQLNREVYYDFFKPLSSLGAVDFDRPPSRLSLYVDEPEEFDFGFGFDVDADFGERFVGDGVAAREMRGWSYNEMFGEDLFGASTPYKRHKELEVGDEGEVKERAGSVLDIDKLGAVNLVNLASKLKTQMKSKPKLKLKSQLQPKRGLRAICRTASSLPASPSPGVGMNYMATQSFDDVAMSVTLTSCGLASGNHDSPQNKFGDADRSPWIMDSIISPPTFYIDQARLGLGGQAIVQPSRLGDHVKCQGAMLDGVPELTSIGVETLENVNTSPMPTLDKRITANALPSTCNSPTQANGETVVTATAKRTRSGTILAPPARKPTATRTRSGTITAPAFQTRNRSGTITAAPAAVAIPARSRSGTITAGARAGSGSIRGDPLNLIQSTELAGNSIPEIGADREAEEGYIDAEFTPVPILEQLVFSSAPNPDIVLEEEDETEETDGNAHGIVRAFSSSPDPLHLGGGNGAELNRAWQILDEPPSPFLRRGLRALTKSKFVVKNLNLRGAGRKGNLKVRGGGRAVQDSSDLSPSTDPIDFLSCFDEGLFNRQREGLGGAALEGVGGRGKKREGKKKRTS